MRLSNIFIGLFLTAGLFGMFYTMFEGLGAGYGLSTSSAYSNQFSSVTARQTDISTRWNSIQNFTTQDSITPVGGITTTISVAANVLGLFRSMAALPGEIVLGSGGLIFSLANNIGITSSPFIGMLITIFTVLLLFAIIAIFARWYV